MDLTDLMHELFENYPDKCIVNVSDYENTEHETYKHLYENVVALKNDLEENNFNLASDNQNLEEELSQALDRIKYLEGQIAILNKSLSPTLDGLKEFCNSKVVVSNIKSNPADEDEGIFNYDELAQSIASSPGVYGNLRPSWFTPLQDALSRENVKRKNIDNTSGTLLGMIRFWKKEGNRKDRDPKKVASEYDEKRKNDILELLSSDCSNEEKYLKYFLLTPGLDKDFLKTLDGAAELNINAKLIISLLEQPGNRYNKEIIESYVSRIHKGTEFNLKQELAEELVQGKWYITAKVNGTEEKFQVIPESVLQETIAKINSLSDYLDSSAGEGLSANLAESPSDEIIYETKVQFVPENNSFEEPEPEMPSFVDFDDSMLNDDML